MKNSIRGFIFICIITLFTACSFKTTSLEINNYAIDFKLNNNTFNSTSKEIFIEKPIVNKSFDTYSIFYRTKPYEFEEYALNKWINKPSNMLYINLFEVIESSNIFKKVYKEKRKDHAIYTLKTNVIDIYNSIENDKSYAVLKVKFYIQLGKDNIRSFTYDKRILTQENNPYGFVVAINEGFQEVLREVLLEITNLK